LIFHEVIDKKISWLRFLWFTVYNKWSK